MPLYSYVCESCEAAFEVLVRAEDVPQCPSCGGAQLQQQIARICAEIKYPAIARSWRKAAARSGDLSNFSAAERKL